MAEDADPAQLIGAIRWQAEACARLESPMYADLLARVADDVASGGVCRAVLAGHERDSAESALALRLAGGVHLLVLSGEAAELAAFYPSTGGRWDPQAGWRAYEEVLREHGNRVRDWLEQPPQTNEVGRSAALMGGLLRIGEKLRAPVRLREIGASGGLNLRADRYFYTDEGGRGYGLGDSPVQLTDAWRGRPLQPWDDIQVEERIGGDVSPVDVSTEEGRLLLMAYVWPDQTPRLDRLRAAFEVAAQVPAEVRPVDAVSFVRELELADGALTVLWHSVMWQYLSSPDQAAVTARIEELGAGATRTRPFAHLFLEPTRRTADSDQEFLVVLKLWPGGERQILGAAHPHGVPTTWE